MEKRRLAIFISGGGTTMEQVLLAINDGRLQNVEPVLVIASKLEAGGIAKAKVAGMSADDIIIVRPKWFLNREDFGSYINESCKARGVDLIFQMGWLPMTPRNVVAAHAGQIFNQHPGALDPGYLGFGGDNMFGMRVHWVALEFARATGRWFTEATVHRVTEDEKFDLGEIRGMTRVQIFPDDTPESLQQRVLPVEHQLVIQTIQNVVDGILYDWPREERLIQTPEEAWLLGALIMQAKEAYPKG
jgi:phosphoribosylglycinamide formyltransferase 1